MFIRPLRDLLKKVDSILALTPDKIGLVPNVNRIANVLAQDTTDGHLYDNKDTQLIAQPPEETGGHIAVGHLAVLVAQVASIFNSGNALVSEYWDRPRLDEADRTMRTNNIKDS